MHRTSFPFFVKFAGLRGREEAELKRRRGGRGKAPNVTIQLRIKKKKIYHFSALLKASCCCVVAIGLGEFLGFVLSSVTVP